jgi:hypothetical protein
MPVIVRAGIASHKAGTGPLVAGTLLLATSGGAKGGLGSAAGRLVVVGQDLPGAKGGSGAAEALALLAGLAAAEKGGGGGVLAPGVLAALLVGFAGVLAPGITGTLPARALSGSLGAWSRTGNLPGRSLVGTLMDDD